MENPGDRLRADLERLAGRVYSEEGIPMFLACEDLASGIDAGQSAAVTLTPLNEDLASAFSRDASVWQGLRPAAPVTDVGKIVEVLAVRNFGASATEQNP